MNPYPLKNTDPMQYATPQQKQALFDLFTADIQLNQYFVDEANPNDMIVMISKGNCAGIFCKEAFGKIHIGVRGGITGKVRYGYSNMMGKKHITVQSVKQIIDIMR